MTNSEARNRDETSHSPRSERNRDLILRAARRLFVERGYVETTVADIAEAAGVALQTVYSTTGSKSQILAGLLERVARDARADQVNALAQVGRGPWAVLASGPRVERALMEHGADVVRLVFENAGVHPDVRQARDGLLSRARAGAESAMSQLAEAAVLRPGLSVADAADRALAILHPGVHLFLSDRGWSSDQIQAWTLEQLVQSVTTLPLDEASEHLGPAPAPASDAASDTASGSAGDR